MNNMIFGVLPCIYNDDGSIDYKAHFDAGFKSIDLQDFTSNKNKAFSFNNKEFISYYKKQYKEAAESGIVFNQLHSFWVWPPQYYDKDAESREKELQYYYKAIRGAHLLNCKYIAIHHRLPLELDDPNTNKETYLTTVDFLKRLIPYARKYKVTLCLENLPFPFFDVFNVKNTINIIKEVNSKYCQMCLDTGHANMTEKDLFASLKEAGKYIKIFHVHDNDGTKDSHLNPGKGNINWKSFSQVLKDINFKGIVSLETGVPKDLPKEEKIIALKKLYETTKELIK